MFVSLPSRKKAALRWATPVLFAALWLAFLWAISRPDDARGSLWLDWGALSTGLTHPLDWWATLQDGSVLRLFTALFLHADWSHLLGNLVFLLIFGLPAERVLGPWRLLLLFLVGGAVSNLVAIYTMGSPDQIIIGASGAVSALIGAYLALFPGARLVFAHIGPSFGMVAWWAHSGGCVFGVVYGGYVRAAIARRLRKRHGF